MKTAMPLPFFADDRAVKHWDHGHAYTVARIDPNDKFTPESRPDFAAYLAHSANLYPELVEALEGLFRECTMVHTRWGNGCNQREADAAIAAARAALAKATQ